MVRFSRHVEFKIELLNKHGFKVNQEMALDTVTKPDRITQGNKGRFIAQKKITERHVLRVIFEKHNEDIEIVTLYPGLRSRYED